MRPHTLATCRVYRGRNSLRWREAIEGYFFMAPAVLGFLVFTLFPMLASAFLSLTEYNLLLPPQWVGIGNYLSMVSDPFVWQSLKVTLTYVIIGLPLGLSFALLIAILMNQNVPGIALWRTIYLLPSVISGVSVAVLWRWIFNPEFGLLNTLLGYIGIKGPDWIGDPYWALPSLIIMGLWGIGGTMLVFLAGLQGIPADLYEAVAIDGGSTIAKFRHVTLPMLSPVVLFNLVMAIIWSFQYFTEVYILTGGGPENATLFYMLYLYRNAFSYLEMGYASALAWILFLIVLLLTVVTFKTTPLWVYYEGERERR